VGLEHVGQAPNCPKSLHRKGLAITNHKAHVPTHQHIEFHLYDKRIQMQLHLNYYHMQHE